MNMRTLLDKLLGSADWGIHPDDRKRPAADVPIRVMPAPERLYLPLSQHSGAPARPVVLVGQKVKKGQCLAEAQGMVSAPVHASTSGTVVAISEVTAPHPSGLTMPAIVLEPDGLDEWIALQGCDDPFALSAAELNKKVAAAGVVGMGGGTFPSAVKLTGANRAGIHTVIINGGECEPYLSCDDVLMRTQAAGVVDGVRLIVHASGAKQALIGIEDNKPEAIAAMQAAAAGFAEVRVCPVPARFPMGFDKQMVKTLTGIEVPADGRSFDAGVLVNNVGTALAVSQAVREGRPLVSRLVTVSGACVSAPGNVDVPLGTLAQDVLAFVGGLKGDGIGLARRVIGGPMMGSQVQHWRVPVMKGVSGILALDREEARDEEAHDCIRCGSCVEACPMGLLPLDMAAHIRKEALGEAVDLGLKDCIACGCCAYVCPSSIPLVQHFTYAKNELSARDRATLRMESTKKLAQAREARLAQEAREKAEAAAKRKAERAAATAAAAAKTTASADTSPQGEPT